MAARILHIAEGTQDSSKAAADTWAGKEKGSAEVSDSSLVHKGEGMEQSWVLGDEGMDQSWVQEGEEME